MAEKELNFEYFSRSGKKGQQLQREKLGEEAYRAIKSQARKGKKWTPKSDPTQNVQAN